MTTTRYCVGWLASTAVTACVCVHSAIHHLRGMCCGILTQNANALTLMRFKLSEYTRAHAHAQRHPSASARSGAS